MGKRKGSKKVHVSKNIEDLEDENVDPESEDFFYDDVDKFHANKEKETFGKESDNSSDEEFDEEEEVLGIDDEDDASDDESDADDSEDEHEDDEMPSNQAWGKKRSAFYGAESVAGLQGVDRDMVEDAEEEEALKIQQRLAEEIDEAQFDFFQMSATPVEAALSEKTLQSEKIATDVSKLSVKAQWQLLKQDSPELKDLIKDFKEKGEELQSQLCPLLDLVKKGRIQGKAAIYVQTKFNLYSSYLVNISFYMALKSKGGSLKNHPIVRRLAQYRTMINKLSNVDELFESEIAKLLDEDISAASGESDTDAKEDSDDAGKGESESNEASAETKTRKRRLRDVDVTTDSFTSLSERLKLEGEQKSETEEPLEENIDEDERRAVNYTIMKNKGAQAKKRKIDRNPRVKHREKYRKAKIRRKGQVKTYKPELNKYSGEASGIRAGVVRGVRIR